MIMNEHLLNNKEKQLVDLVERFFQTYNFGDFNVLVDWGEIHDISFENNLFRFVFRIKPAEPDCEEQLQIPTIIFSPIKQHNGIFHQLMIVLAEFCCMHEKMPILFCEVVSNKFSTKLINKYHGILLADDYNCGKYIAILPEKILS
ncbi:hypothetical protein [Anaerotignum sp.]|nr:hypothetical protein [Anaerotignum sp.]MBQ7757504.1 hypothetical protein [Anaerotignum sp.]